MAQKVDYPFHAGITEAGTLLCGAVKSAVGIGLLLNEGLADTIRVSLTAPPEEEVRVAYQILAGLGLRQRGPNVISCPTCGRVEVNLRRIAAEVEKRLAGIPDTMNVAVMGCMVNGPGEAKDADVGVACGKGVGILFKEGKLVCRLDEKEIVPALVREVEKIARDRHAAKKS
jgi:(E)-4-hydroxy-3-methylbut-2-enyl-diphosphate synthase